MKLKPELCRYVILEKRRLRMARRGKPEAVKENVWVALKSLTEFRAHPDRPELATQAASNVRRAHAVASKN